GNQTDLRCFSPAISVAGFFYLRTSIAPNSSPFAFSSCHQPHEKQPQPLCPPCAPSSEVGPIPGWLLSHRAISRKFGATLPRLIEPSNLAANPSSLLRRGFDALVNLTLRFSFRLAGKPRSLFGGPKSLFGSHAAAEPCRFCSTSTHNVRKTFPIPSV